MKIATKKKKFYAEFYSNDYDKLLLLNDGALYFFFFLIRRVRTPGGRDCYFVLFTNVVFLKQKKTNTDINGVYEKRSRN